MGNYLVQVTHFGCIFWAGFWPVYVMGRFHRQQDRILDKIRSHYILATTALMADDAGSAAQRLHIIRRLEAYWRLGASIPIRAAHIGYASVTSLGVAFVGQVFGYHLNTYGKPRTLPETFLYVMNDPWLVLLVGVAAVLFSLNGLRHAIELESKPWSEFYGNRLAAALKAGRGIDNAPQHEFVLPEDVTARELLGLNATFTKSELRSAWLRLARELHPDRWTNSGEAVSRMKEAGLKRVNAARDELEPYAL
jgi:hypothetical protein